MARSLPPRPFLYPIVDVATLGDRPVGSAVAGVVAGGAKLVQFRAKGLPDRRFLALASEALAAARRGGAMLVVNDRPDVAVILGADGVHLGQDDLEPSAVRSLLPPGTLLGVSTHDLEQLRRATDEPVDYVAIGPVFPTRSKAAPDPVVGLATVRAARALTSRPLIAIGGITEDNARSVVEAGADGLAVISALLSQPDLAAAARRFAAVLASP
ncbi:MAG: thiamine phosphate synthase [Acidobacteria bacterium]|nr:MAG: thiamine phosphate synthase [Acidobacteriota bacterium]